MRVKASREKMMLKRNKKRLRTEARIVYDELLNIAEGEMIAQFEEALERGELIEFMGTEEDLQILLSDAVDTYFGIVGGEERDALPGS